MKYAFIDVQNNDSTALKTLGFVIDNKKLVNYLVQVKNYDKVFLYPGIEISDIEKKTEHEDMQSEKIIVRPKFYKIYRERDKYIKNDCLKCGEEVLFKISGKVSYKCNCDVDLTIDVIDNMGEGNELMIFTGDGDFECLISRAVQNKSTVKIVSSDQSIKRKDGSIQSRFSKKLQDFIKNNQDKVKFLELNNYRNLIQKDIDQDMLYK